MPNKTKTRFNIDADVMETLRVSKFPVDFVMLPMTISKTIEINAGESTQVLADQEVRFAAREKRHMSAVVHNHCESVD